MTTKELFTAAWTKEGLSVNGENDDGGERPICVIPWRVVITDLAYPNLLKVLAEEFTRMHLAMVNDEPLDFEKWGEQLGHRIGEEQDPGR